MSARVAVTLEDDVSKIEMNVSAAQSVTPGVSEAAAHAARLLARPSLAPINLAALAAAVECFVVALGFWFVFYIAGSDAAFRPVAAAGAAGLLSILATVLIAAAGGYRLPSLVRPRSGIPRALAGVGLALAPVLLVQGDMPAGQILAAAAGVSLVLLLPVRCLLSAGANWAVESGLTARRAVLAGGGAEAERLVRGLAARSGNEIQICGIFDDRGSARVPDRILHVPKLGRFEDLVAFCRAAEIDLIILCLPEDAHRRIGDLLERFRVLPVPVHLSAFNPGLDFLDTSGAALSDASFRAERRIAKRVFDLVIGGALTLLFAPLMLVVALLIRLDSPGPVFFRQQRHGFNDRTIRIWKFRTMYVDQCDPGAVRVVTRGDPRVTRLGRILRKSSLDELPQLFNVLDGSLSLVGPRPHALDARSSRQERFAQIVSGYSARHRLPPGITGWAQIHGWRGEVSDPDSLRHRFEHDLYYIENWSLWLDLRVLLRTPLSLVNTSRAY
jgi:Undecaprenyl-phosphate glucose phosphotransferase